MSHEQGTTFDEDRSEAYRKVGLEVILPEAGAMPKNDRDVLEVLKFELDFIEQGGYGRSARTPLLPTSTFQDSLTCINFGDPKRSHSCNECLLMQFVPPEGRGEAVPCHHIPLSSLGETVHTLEHNWKTQQDMEEGVKNWLRATIKRIEKEQVKDFITSNPS